MRFREVKIVDGVYGPMTWCICDVCNAADAAVMRLTPRRRFLRAQRRARLARRGWA